MVSTSERQLNVQEVRWGSLTWVNIERPSLAEMEYLRERYHFHQLSLDDCLSVIQIPKLDQFEDHMFLVLHFPRFVKERRLTVPSEVDVFAGANYVITVHAGDLRPLGKLFHDCQASEAMRQDLLGRGPGYLLYRILDGLVDYCFPILSKIIENVNQLEERVFDQRGQAVVREMAVLRRDILSYMRMVPPQIEVLEEMANKDFRYLNVQEDVYFGDLVDHMHRISNELQALKEVVVGLNETHDSLGNLRTNDISRVLTVIATVLLPFLVVSGIYGMNVALPGEEDPLSFILIILLTGVISASMLIFFRLRRWL